VFFHVYNVELRPLLVLVDLERHGRCLVVHEACDTNAFTVDCGDFVWLFFLVDLRPMFLDELVRDVVAVCSCIDESSSRSIVKYDCLKYLVPFLLLSNVY
jgi:hypothetical protein